MQARQNKKHTFDMRIMTHLSEFNSQPIVTVQTKVLVEQLKEYIVDFEDKF